MMLQQGQINTLPNIAISEYVASSESSTKTSGWEFNPEVDRAVIPISLFLGSRFLYNNPFLQYPTVGKIFLFIHTIVYCTL